MRNFGLRSRVWVAAVLFALVMPLSGQEKGEPGRFDFYLLNLAWAPEFCSIQGTSPQCVMPTGFVVHGLWPQNFDGSYPVSCGTRRGPARMEESLDITPDRLLLEHEWSKHGTCTTLKPEEFFRLEHKAFRSVSVPKEFKERKSEAVLRTDEIRGLFERANPSFPRGSILVSCDHDRLTAIEACFTKDGLKPMVCRGLRECDAREVRVLPVK